MTESAVIVLPEPDLAHQRQRLSPRDREADILDDLTFADLDAELLHGEECVRRLGRVMPIMQRATCPP